MARFKRKDHFYRRAKDRGYRSRAAYKLSQFHERHGLFKRGGRVIDLGAAPGGWMQVAADLVGRRGFVVGVDLLDIDPLGLANTEFILGDMLSEETRKRALESLGGPADVVLSDMAHNLTGIRVTDTERSADLAELALSVAKQVLEKGGNFVVKVFPGDRTSAFQKELRRLFDSVKRTKPEATRSSSSEVYFVALGFQGQE